MRPDLLKGVIEKYMRTIIFYFSGTGNCLKVAKDLAENLGDSKIISIPSALGSKVDSSADRIGIVFPVYFWGVPKIVAQFIKRLKTYKYTFIIITYAAKPGGALKKAQRLMERQGAALSSGFGIPMPENAITMYDVDPIEKQLEMFNKEKERIREIAGIIKEGRTWIDKHPSMMNWLFSGILYNAIIRRISHWDKSFHASKNCNGCRICENVCPVGNIEIDNGHPVWKHKCELCVACIQWCPKECIQYKNITEKHKHYRNPDIKLKDLILYLKGRNE